MNRAGIASLVSGLVFGAGLAVSGMTLPAKVVGFLDFFGHWDPTLIFVMGGAIAVHATVYWLVRKRRSPLFAERFQLPTRRDIEPKLIVGAALFGLGWGLGGYCPGPAVVSLPSGSVEVGAFVVAMLVAMWAVQRLEAAQSSRARARSEAALAEGPRPASEGR
jgi:uncharacterized membrane protein YedE/YeeE